jgi:iron complex transport system substrate-binding protein
MLVSLSRVVSSRVVLIGVLLACAACGSDGASVSSDTAADTSSVPTSASEVASTVPADVAAPDTQPDVTELELDAGAPDLGRVVSLAEEFILADVMTLGIEPIASSASVEEVGFQGLSDFDTSGIEVLPMTTLSLEHLASLEPDTIITLQFWVDQVGAEALEGMADLVIVPDGLYGAERLTTLGELVGRPEHAAAAAAELDAAVLAAQDTIGEGCVVSLAAVYSGPSVAAFVDGPWDIPSSIQAAGCRLDPGASDATPDANGRVYLSPEQLGMLDSERLILLQSDTVEGEPEALAEIQANPIWQTLPAVVNDDVDVFDRLGYPGAAGQIRFLDEFSALIAAS